MIQSISKIASYLDENAQDCTANIVEANLKSSN